MRRIDREKDENEALKILSSCDFATLSMVNPDGAPYAVPISPFVVNKTLYFHCATVGEKLDCIRKNPNVCISCASNIIPVPMKFTTKYSSAIAFGTCKIVENEEDKIFALNGICKKYANINSENFVTEIAKNIARTCVCKVEISTLTAKVNE